MHAHAHILSLFTCHNVVTRMLRGMKLFEEEEAQIMKDVKGWTVGESVYHTDRWISPPAERLKSPEGAKSFGI